MSERLKSDKEGAEITMDDFPVLVNKRKLRADKEYLPYAFEAAFSKTNNVDIWEAVGSIPFTRKFLNNIHFMMLTDSNATVGKTNA